MGNKLSDEYDEFDEGIDYLKDQEDFEKNKFRNKKESKPVIKDSSNNLEGYLAFLGMIAAFALFAFLVRSCLGV